MKLPQIFDQNKQWAEKMLREEPGFFEKLSSLQRPEYLWIGCSDSRVPANQITGLLPGAIFVHRNVGNIVGTSDLNCLSVIQYAVDVLEVKHIIVCGHYGCGAIEAAWNNKKFGLIDYWVSAIKHVRERNQLMLAALAAPQEQLDRLCELNVLEQAKNVCGTAIVQDAWARKRDLTVHGWIYRLNNGRLKDLGFCVSSPSDLPELY